MASLATFLLAGGDPTVPDKHGKDTYAFADAENTRAVLRRASLGEAVSRVVHSTTGDVPSAGEGTIDVAAVVPGLGSGWKHKVTLDNPVD